MTSVRSEFSARVYLVARPEEKHNWREACRALERQTGERWTLARFIRTACDQAEKQITAISLK